MISSKPFTDGWNIQPTQLTLYIDPHDLQQDTAVRQQLYFGRVRVPDMNFFSPNDDRFTILSDISF